MFHDGDVGGCSVHTRQLTVPRSRNWVIGLLLLLLELLLVVVVLSENIWSLFFDILKVIRDIQIGGEVFPRSSAVQLLLDQLVFRVHELQSEMVVQLRGWNHFSADMTLCFLYFLFRLNSSVPLLNRDFLLMLDRNLR